MITDVLLDHPWMTPVALAVLIVLAPIVGGWLVGRTKVAWGFAGLALVPVVALTLVPVDRQLYERCTIQWVMPTPGRVEVFANLVLFVAPVFLAGVATRRPMPALLCGIGLSLLIEVVQALIPGIGRSCDSTDLLANTLGAAIGSGLAAGVLVLTERRAAS